MKWVVALVFIFNGVPDHSKSLYFESIDRYSIENCRWYCQEISKERKYWEATKCVCRIAWVDAETPTIK